MAKLNKRQVIILSIAALFVLYAIYELVIAGPAAKKAKTAAEPVKIEAFVSDLQSDLIKDIVAGVDVHIINKAEANWERNPFWERQVFKEWAAKDGTGRAGAKIVYSGYVDSGKKRLAVINGYEYREGEQLEMEGFFLKSISPSRVLIVNKNTGNELEIPIQE
ncbi:MAG TPA: hypothetical protein P5294_06355 [Smithellaceae bacterium]|nr:hypothetical protein [Smithellaceae bacterium]HRS89216.1 hypothetical protein [Smithellaceae bacterium]HRV26140.1 hypothetical protein [Smithellaceae bacterium]